MGFPWGLLAFRRIEYPLLRGGIKGGGKLMRVPRHGLPLGEAGSHRGADGRLKRDLSVDIVEEKQ